MDAGSNTCWEAFVTYSNTACCGDTIKYNLTSAESCQLHMPTQVWGARKGEYGDCKWQQDAAVERLSKGKNNLLFSFTVFILGLNKSKRISDVILKTFVTLWFCYLVK